MGVPLATSILCLTIVVSAVSVNADFSPECSFVGGQCMYTIKLGHTGQCDQAQTPTIGTSSGGCCGDLSNKYTQLKDTLDSLQLKVDIMATNMASGSLNMTQLENELNQALTARNDIMAVLTRKESELNTTKDELAKVMGQAASEIKNLRDQLAKTHSDLFTCQQALGTVTHKGGSGPSVASIQPGDYDFTYYNFNEQPQGFTFPSTTYRNKLKLMHGGSGSGPTVEHSWGVRSGSYLGIDPVEIASHSSKSVETTLMAESGTFPPANAYCIMFWYYMEGRNIQTLAANVRIKGGTGYPIYSRRGPTSTNQWQLATIPLDSEYTAYDFKFDITMSSNAYYSYSSGRLRNMDTDGFIAVDDLYVYNTTCQNIPRYPATAYRNTVGNVTSFYTFHATPMSWTKAYDACRQAGPFSALVSIETDQEQAFLVNTIQSSTALNAMGQNGFYTSGTDADREQNFYWTNTGIRRTIGKGSWHVGQPNNVAGNQDCLLMEYAYSNYEWGDVDCDTEHPFICEVEYDGVVP